MSCGARAAQVGIIREHRARGPLVAREAGGRESLDVAQARGGRAGLLEQARDLHVAVLHRLLPRRSAIERLVGPRAVREQQLHALRVADVRCAIQREAQQRDGSGLRMLRRRIGREAVAQQDRKLLRRALAILVDLDRHCIGRVCAVLEQSFRELARARVRGLVGHAGVAAAEHSGECT